MDLGARVSRKKEFVPPLTGSIKDYEPPSAAAAGEEAAFSKRKDVETGTEGTMKRMAVADE